MMNLHELERTLILAQRDLSDGNYYATGHSIVAAKLMVQAEMARIERLTSGNSEPNDDRRSK